MIDVDRILRIAVERKKAGLVGMILSVDQVIALVARGDGVGPAYQMRIGELEREIERLRKRGEEEALHERYSDAAEERGGYVTSAEVAERCGIADSTACRWAHEGWVSAEKRRVMGPDGIPRDTWYIDPDEAQMMAALSRPSRNAIGRGAMMLHEAVMAEMQAEEEVVA